ncbi:MAG TPA: hypothetical protein VLJ10_04985 [Candidatus Bathyarchaeia archaeon]|nr:hypothetical protein [Candidatus Bathyarchaeia archaeon]
MKKRLAVFVCLLLVGCAYGKQHVESVLDNPPKILTDPQYTEYEKQVNEAESRYLNGEISYADYVAKKQSLEDRYTRQADKQRMIVEGAE